jgi:uncharacterized protein (DUF169 family)
MYQLFNVNPKEVTMSSRELDYSVFQKFNFERPPVGVKYLTTKPKGMKKLDKILDFCEMLVEAQQGNAFYVTKEEFTCIGPMLLGMVADDPTFESGRVGPELGAFKDARANRRIYDYLPRIKHNIINYVAFAPIDKLSFEPDVMIILANVSQAEIFIRAKSYTSGEMWSARGTSVVGCAWLYLYPYLSGEMNLTVTGFGFGMRARQLFPEGQILISIPWDVLPGIIDNLKEMAWVPHSYTIGGAEHKKKVRKIAADLAKET